jgi:hypothetical protein
VYFNGNCFVSELLTERGNSAVFICACGSHSVLGT